MNRGHPALTPEHAQFHDTLRRVVRASKSECVYTEVKAMTIGGGSEESMKHLAARQLGGQP